MYERRREFQIRGGCGLPMYLVKFINLLDSPKLSSQLSIIKSGDEKMKTSFLIKVFSMMVLSLFVMNGYVFGQATQDEWDNVGVNVFLKAQFDRVGIGRPNPRVKLDVQGNIATNSTFGFSSVQVEPSPFGVYISAPADLSMGLFTASQERIRIDRFGNIGIGTKIPNAKLDVRGQIRAARITLTPDQGPGSVLDLFIHEGEPTILALRDLRIRYGVEVSFISGNSERVRIDQNGTITANEVVVTPSPFPDFVFEDDYNLQPLDELEQSIKTNKHLPGIPSAKEVETNGVSLGKMQTKLLQKIEELTLYVIDLKNENDQLNRRVASLENASNN